MVTHGNAKETPPKRVVLLGAGFVGTAIDRHLKTIGIDALALRSGDIDLAKASATEELASRLRSDDAVVMLAVTKPGRQHDAAALLRSVAMMQNVCDAVTRSGCAHFIYFSSDAVYPSAAGRVTEETSPSPGGLYGITHLTRELMTQELKAPWLVLRPTQIYGVKNPHNSYGPNKFCRAAKEDRKISLSDSGAAMRDHIDVDDVAALTVQCLRRRSAGTLNVATGVSYSFRDVADIVARRFGVPLIIGAATQVTHRHYDITNIIKAFPDIRFTTLEAGVARMHPGPKERA
jgi:UDP-glucose 4-epimerase